MSDIDLNAPATLTSLSELVGVSRQAIQKLNTKKAFPPGESNLAWLHIYVEQLRAEASGRGGEDQKALTTWRKEEAKENTLNKRLDRLEKESILIVVDDAITAMAQWGITVKQSVEYAAGNAVERIESRHGIQLDDDDLNQHFRAALADIAAATDKLADGFAANSGDANPG